VYTTEIEPQEEASVDRYVVRIIIEADEDSFYAHCPGLPEVQTCGQTPEEAAENAKTAASAVLKAKQRFGDSIQTGFDLLKIHAPTKEEALALFKREEQVVV